MTLITAPIVLGDDVWIGTDAYVGPGVIVGDRSIVGARASVYKNVPPDIVVGGNPARYISKREFTA
jgi:putative colanic acid biosynthesis acetyltransferase WcaF